MAHSNHASPRSALGSPAKVTIPLEPNAWHGFETETVWTERVGPGSYRLANVPFFAKGVSFGDVLAARMLQHDLLYESVVQRGGHSTYRIVPAGGTDHPRFRLRWKALEALGCSYEFAGAVVAVDVPPTTDVYQVYSLLESGAREGEWDFDEGHCGHPLDREAAP